MPIAPRTPGKSRHARPADAGARHAVSTADLLTAATKGLSRTQRDRVLAAIERVGEESAETAARRIQRNVIGNANELLRMMTPPLAARGRWRELRAIWTFLAHLDVPVDHARLARRLEKDLGPDLAARYRDRCR